MGDQLETTFLWGPNRYSDVSVLFVELAPSKPLKGAVEFVASHAATLVTAALEMPSRAITVAGEPGHVVIEVPLHSIGRHAVLEALALWAQKEGSRRAQWPGVVARARQWATAAERRLVSLLAWARERDLPVRPTEAADRWSVGDGAQSTIVSLATFDAQLLARLDAQVAAEKIGRLPAIVIGGAHGKTACARLMARALTSWELAPEVIGDFDEVSSLTAARRLSPDASMAIIEASSLADARAPYPDFPVHLTIILRSDGPPATVEQRYEAALTIAKRTLPGGTLVLSADDEIGRRLHRALRKAEVNLLRVSVEASNQRVADFSLIDGHLVVAKAPRASLLSVRPFGTVGGWPSSYATALVAAFAGLEALNAKPREEIVETLTRYALGTLGEGCFSLHLVRGARVLVHRANTLPGHTQLCSEVRAVVQQLGVDTVRAFVEPPRVASKGDVKALLDGYRKAGAKVTRASPKDDELLAQVEHAVRRAGPDGLIVVAAPKVGHVEKWCQRLAIGAAVDVGPGAEAK